VVGRIIAISDAAARLGKRKKHLFKVIDRLRIAKRFEKSATARGQKVAYIAEQDFEALEEYFASSGDVVQEHTNDSQTGGVFYLIQLEPEHDPSRFKLGFATNLEERLRAHKTSAPYSTVIKTWRCKLLWEKTAIESISRGCEKIHTEVFRGVSIETILDRCEQFFALLPNVDGEG
jgi:hypothetical protein